MEGNRNIKSLYQRIHPNWIFQIESILSTAMAPLLPGTVSSNPCFIHNSYLEGLIRLISWPFIPFLPHSDVWGESSYFSGSIHFCNLATSSGVITWRREPRSPSSSAMVWPNLVLALPKLCTKLSTSTVE
jgi:hypothetical protein